MLPKLVNFNIFAHYSLIWTPWKLFFDIFYNFSKFNILSTILESFINNGWVSSFGYQQWLSNSMDRLSSFKFKLLSPFYEETLINVTLHSLVTLLQPLIFMQKLPLWPGYHTFLKSRDPKDNKKPCLAFS